MSNLLFKFSEFLILESRIPLLMPFSVLSLSISFSFLLSLPPSLSSSCGVTAGFDCLVSPQNPLLLQHLSLSTAPVPHDPSGTLLNTGKVFEEEEEADTVLKEVRPILNKHIV